MARKKPPKRRNRARNGLPDRGPYSPVPSRSRPEVLNPNYITARSLQLEGADPGDNRQGSWPITANRVLYGWGAVTVEDWPYSNDEGWYLEEPGGLDEKAKKRRTQHYQRIYDIEECKRALIAGKGVAVSLPATRGWFEAHRGAIPEIGSKSEIIGIHYVSLVGYADGPKRLRFANSWGSEWGDGGYGTLSYDYYEKWACEAWVASSDFDSRQVAIEALAKGPPRRKSPDGSLELMWGVEDPPRTSSAIHCREIYDPVNDERMGWAFATTRGGFLDIEEFFVRPAYRRKGHGTRIARMLSDLSVEIGLPMKLMVSFALDFGLHAAAESP
jgi:GNAT superfamily N-acetyltransferase